MAGESHFLRKLRKDRFGNGRFRRRHVVQTNLSPERLQGNAMTRKLSIWRGSAKAQNGASTEQQVIGSRGMRILVVS